MKKNIIEIEDAHKKRKAKRAELAKQEKVQKRREKSLEKASRPKMSRGKKLIACGVVAIAVLIFVSSGYRIIDLNLNKNVYEKRYEEKLAEKARLEKVLDLIDDPDYVGQQARDRFHMLRDGEILYVFPEQEALEAQ
ncbi:MAG: septum formation initiator family protein [Clostridiales bacterium]|nr:septum formation initiator family protein [Clostridiales bacterium]